MKTKITQEISKRPHDATREALAKCLEWIEACRKLGWKEKDMDNLEGLFWRWHDKDGQKKLGRAAE